MLCRESNKTKMLNLNELLKSSWVLIFIIWEEFIIFVMRNQDKCPLMYEYTTKDTIKSEIPPHLPVTKRGYGSQGELGEVVP